MKRTKVLAGMIASMLLLTGCGNTITSSNNSAPFTPKANAKIDSNITSTFNLAEKTTYPCPFIAFQDVMIFTNPDDNDRISQIKYPLPDSYIKTSDVTDFKNYSSSTITNINNDIYFANYKDYDNLYAISLSSDKATKVLDTKVKDLIAIGTTLYYINKDDNYTLYSYDITSKQKVKITTHKVGKYLVNGDNVLYENVDDKSKLYKASTDGKDVKALSDFSVDSFVIYDSQILALNSSDNNNLYNINPSSLKATRIYLMNGTDLKCFNNELYFVNQDDVNHLYSLKVDLTQNKVSSSLIYNDAINYYYPTDKGIFIEKGLNINNRYVYILKTT